MKKEIRKLAEEKINLGKSRQETFDELHAELRLPAEDVAKVVRNIPSLSARRKFVVLNIILAILLIINVILQSVGIAFPLYYGFDVNPFLFVPPIVNALFAIAILRYKGVYYRVVLVIFSIALLGLTARSIWGVFELASLVDIGRAVAIVVLCAILSKKLVSAYDIKKVWDISPEGKRRIKQIIKFPDEAAMPVDTLDADI